MWEQEGGERFVENIFQPLKAIQLLNKEKQLEGMPIKYMISSKYC
jgi:hypothetical protein